MFVTASKVRKTYSIARSTLRKWAIDGKLEYRQLPGGKRLYKESDLARLIGEYDGKQKENIIYARVSSTHQKEDLSRQVSDLEHCYPNYSVITDIASGLNFKRKGLLKILDLIFKRSVSVLVVAHRDRLCRFGFELFESICRSHEVQLVVHSKESGSQHPELAEDLFAVVNFFVAKNNGRRSGINRKRRRCQDDEDHASSEQEST
jgi:predicted site-specific integrase-resolvase